MASKSSVLRDRWSESVRKESDRHLQQGFSVNGANAMAGEELGDLFWEATTDVRDVRLSLSLNSAP